MTEQTLCPYTGSKLGIDGTVNREHVTPIAIGAPESFWVRSHESANSHWNDLVDGPFCNDECVRFLAMANSVRSRSGDITSKLGGRISETGDDVRISLSGSGLDIDFAQPVVSHGATGYTVKGYGDKAHQQAEKLQRNLAKKGVIARASSAQVVETPTVHATIHADQKLIHLQLIKTAYLYTAWCLGDRAITSPSRDQYLNALNGNGIMSADLELTEPIKGHHQFTLLVIDSAAYCEVDLFGVFKGLFVTTLGQPIEVFTQHSKIDLKNRRFTQQKDVPGLLMAFAERIYSMQKASTTEA